MHSENFSRLIWLEGQWEGLQGSGVYHEEWRITGVNQMKGRAYLILKGEILNNEILNLNEDLYGIYYIAEVNHNPHPVSFKLTHLSDKIAVFENPEHDFPQKITYENNNGSLTATVEAVKDNKLKKFEYFLKRIR